MWTCILAKVCEHFVGYHYFQCLYLYNALKQENGLQKECHRETTISPHWSFDQLEMLFI